MCVSYQWAPVEKEGGVFRVYSPGYLLNGCAHLWAPGDLALAQGAEWSGGGTGACTPLRRAAGSQIRSVLTTEQLQETILEAAAVVGQPCTLPPESRQL